MGKPLGEPVAVVVSDGKNGVEVQVHAKHLERGDALYTYKQIKDSKEQDLGIDSIHTQVNYLQSEVLTIVEASFNDPLQRQAVIKLVKGAFNKRHNWFDEIVYGSRGADGSHEADPQSVVNGENNQTTKD